LPLRVRDLNSTTGETDSRRHREHRVRDTHVLEPELVEHPERTLTGLREVVQPTDDIEESADRIVAPRRLELRRRHAGCSRERVEALPALINRLRNGDH